MEFFIILLNYMYFIKILFIIKLIKNKKIYLEKQKNENKITRTK